MPAGEPRRALGTTLIHLSAWKGCSANFVLRHIMLLGTVALMLALSGRGPNAT